MIKPLLQNDSFIANVQQSRSQRDTLNIWWLGQSGYLVQWNDTHLLFDPYLSDSLTKKYADTSRPHVRMTELVVDPARLDFIDVVTSSHNHTDHLDGETLIPLMTVNPEMTVVVPQANLDFAAERLQTKTERLTSIICGSPIQVGAFTLHAVPAAHEALETDENGHHKFIGMIAEAGPWTLYHSGDTMRYEGMVEALSAWDIDIAMLPINGRDPKRGVAGNLSGPEAVELAQEVGIDLIFPCHYDMFEFNTVSPDAFIEAAEAVGQHVCVMQNGERWVAR